MGRYGRSQTAASSSWTWAVPGIIVVALVAAFFNPLMTSGAPPFEWIERARSYMSPLALYYLVVTQKCWLHVPAGGRPMAVSGRGGRPLPHLRRHPLPQR